jgi:hypothetical protein
MKSGGCIIWRRLRMRGDVRFARFTAQLKPCPYGTQERTASEGGPYR